MTVLRPGEHADELISASLTGDLTDAERAALEQHLAGCARCQATLAAFRQERQLISGMRHVQPPADLGARVRTGIEAGELPWWQRRSTLVAMVGSLGAVAAGLLAVVVFSNLRPGRSRSKPLRPSASFEASVSAEPSAPVSIAATPSAVASTTPVPSAEHRPQPSRYAALHRRTAASQAGGDHRAGTDELEISQYGMPVECSAVAGRRWLAFRVMGDATGLIDTYAYASPTARWCNFRGSARLAVLAPAWSARWLLLAFTADRGTSAGCGGRLGLLCTRSEPTTIQLTTTARLCSGLLGQGPATQLLWVSVAGPRSDYVRRPSPDPALQLGYRPGPD